MVRGFNPLTRYLLSVQLKQLFHVDRTISLRNSGVHVSWIAKHHKTKIYLQSHPNVNRFRLLSDVRVEQQSYEKHNILER